jgi:putative endonuclease
LARDFWQTPAKEEPARGANECSATSGREKRAGKEGGRARRIVLHLNFLRHKSAGEATQLKAPHFELGEHGETLALEHLERAGYRIVAANFSLPVGRNLRDAIINAEIDLVAYDGTTLCFIEVKTRASDEIAAPQTNVDLRKRRQIARAGRAYRRMFGLMAAAYRYDVVTVVAKPGSHESRIELLKNFWTDAQLRKRNWHDAYWD